MKTYSEKLKDPRWQKKRLEIMERDRFACQQCGDEKSTLSVHHTYYVSKRDVWDYPSWSLSTLCEDCHKSKHERHCEDDEDGSPKIKYSDWEQTLDLLVEKTEDVSALWDIMVQIAIKKADSKMSVYESIGWAVNLLTAERKREMEASRGR
jgi:hypothetical protein